MSKASALQKQAAEDAAEAASAPPALAQPPTRADIQNDTNRRIVETIGAVAGMHGSEKAAVLLLALGEEAKPIWESAFTQRTVEELRTLIQSAGATARESSTRVSRCWSRSIRCPAQRVSRG